MNYTSLEEVLRLAYAQATEGKGRDRHARDGRSFTNQPILTITREVGYGFPAGQAIKKLTEAAGMMDREAYEHAMQECLGAIVYAAAAYMYIEEVVDARLHD